MSPVDEVISYARTYFGVYYRWGGNTRYTGMDCSGFICDVLRKPGIAPLKGDLSSQGLYDHLRSIGSPSVKTKIQPGAILFFGVDSRKLTHVALAVSPIYMIESAGGNERTVSIAEAISANAGVRESLISGRRNLVDALMPNYP